MFLKLLPAGEGVRGHFCFFIFPASEGVRGHNLNYAQINLQGSLGKGSFFLCPPEYCLHMTC